MRNKKTGKCKNQKSSPAMVQESEAIYMVRKNSNGLKGFSSILSFNQKPESQMTNFEKMAAVENGISKEDLQKLKEKTSMDYDKLARALSVTRATLINKKKQEKFNAGLSERIFGLADIYSYGYDVFENEERFNTWMFRPNQALGGKTPFELIGSQFGRDEVKNVIGRIEYGVYS
ncbi:antitoxin Xre/MbcA/ParS toxin-binding domain-containing protein [Parafilimonas sp.]|uniref:type II RES/Xre toxin-antitoxin system antitoxin n=1 Tax=Parafilimonas sp. TaxID=1969739 RepID=UPI0039E522BE